jgi:hypothetical protein
MGGRRLFGWKLAQGGGGEMSRLRISFILKSGTGEMLALLGIGIFVIKRARA